jgi:hypothetical protein
MEGLKCRSAYEFSFESLERCACNAKDPHRSRSVNRNHGWRL